MKLDMKQIAYIEDYTQKTARTIGNLGTCGFRCSGELESFDGDLRQAVLSFTFQTEANWSVKRIRQHLSFELSGYGFTSIKSSKPKKIRTEFGEFGKQINMIEISCIAPELPSNYKDRRQFTHRLALQRQIVNWNEKVNFYNNRVQKAQQELALMEA